MQQPSEDDPLLAADATGAPWKTCLGGRRVVGLTTIVGALFVLLGISSIFFAPRRMHLPAAASAASDRHALRELDTSVVNDCEAPALPRGQFHVVLSAWAEHTCFTHYLWDLGLTNADVFIFRRVVESRPLQTWNGPCGMVVHERLLLPNKGNEMTAFHSYVVENYHDPPLAVIMLHGHGPNGWHTDCETLMGRARYFYRGLASPSLDPDAAEFSTHMVTLTRWGLPGVDVGLLADKRPLIYSKISRRLQLSEEEEHANAQSCGALFERWGVDVSFSGFWSCCGSFILPWDRILWYPQGYYRDALAHGLGKFDDYYEGRFCWEFPIYSIYREPEITDYVEGLYVNATAVAIDYSMARCRARDDCPER